MKMKSWRFHEFGHIRNLKMEEIDIPKPAEDECLVKVEYAGLNPADRFLIMGLYRGAGNPPFSVGRDACGTVVTPSSEGRFTEGERVVFLRSIVGITREGTLAGYVTVPEAHLAALPEWWSPQDGAAGTHVLLTTWQALSIVANLQPGETVVITGASGGIGLAALILANALGAKTVALSRSEEKRTKLIDMGADHAIDTYDGNLISKIRDLGGADVVIEIICGDFLAKSLEMTNPYGRICIIGALGGIKSEIDPTKLIFKRLQVHGIQVAMYTDSGVQEAWENIYDVIKPMQAKVLIDKIFPFDLVQEAFEHMRQGPLGKVLIGPMESFHK
jgi:NADPH2:quinone reductase